MRKALTLTTLCLTALLSTAGQAQTPVDFMLRTSSEIGTVAERHGLTVVRAVDDGRGVYLMRAVADWRPLRSVLETDSEVVRVELNSDAAIVEAPTGSLNQSTAAILETLPDRTIVPFFNRSVWRGYATQPATALLRTTETHRLYATGGGIVAIIDTGIDATHPALVGGIVPGYDFIRDEAGIPSDLTDLSQSTAAILEGGPREGVFRSALVNQSTAAILEQSTAAILEGEGLPPAFGHGTMVAGLVRVVAPTAQIMPLRVFTNKGSATTFDIVRAIYWAVDHGANVINMSFSLGTASEELLRALNYANEHDVTLVASAGNAGAETLVFPAAFRHVIGVASTSNLDRRSTFSNHGNGLVRIAAPGEALITAYPGGQYAAVWGTSFSAALVSGAASLIVQADPTADPNAIDGLLTEARQIRGLGEGRLNLLDALRKADRR